MFPVILNFRESLVRIIKQWTENTEFQIQHWQSKTVVYFYTG